MCDSVFVSQYDGTEVKCERKGPHDGSPRAYHWGGVGTPMFRCWLSGMEKQS